MAYGSIEKEPSERVTRDIRKRKSSIAKLGSGIWKKLLDRVTREIGQGVAGKSIIKLNLTPGAIEKEPLDRFTLDTQGDRGYNMSRLFVGLDLLSIRISVSERAAHSVFYFAVFAF